MLPKVLSDATIATCKDDTYGLIHNAAVVIDNGTIVWCGEKDKLPDDFASLTAIELSGKLVTPALIDCHTHIVYAGHRAKEFEMRLQGASYAEVSAAGGGINNTMGATRNASVEQLVEASLPRVDALLAEGVGTIEIKSGYGLDTQSEINMLRAARRIGEQRPIRVSTSFLGAHAIPPEYKNRADPYISEVCIPTLRKAYEEGLIDAVDGFCESIAFSPEQIEKVFIEAKALGLPVKLHAEQLTLSGGTVLAAKYQALSADHLEYLDEAGVAAMRDAGVTAVLLPGAFYTLRETQLPPIDLFREYGVPIAIATDCNPGSSPMTSLLLSMNMASTLFRLTPEESLLGVTRNAARALGISDIGQVAEGFRAELAIWNVEHPAELSYRIGFNALHERVFSDTNQS